MNDFMNENGPENVVENAAEPAENPPKQSTKGGKREGAGRRPKPVAGSFEDLFEQLNTVRAQQTAEAASDQPNPTKQRLLADLGTSLWQQIEFTNDKMKDTTTVENASLKAQVDKLQQSVETLTPKAAGYDQAIKERNAALTSAKQSESELHSTATRIAGLLAFVNYVTRYNAPVTAELTEHRRTYAFEMLFSKQGDNISNEDYEKFGVPISLWRQYKVGFTEQDHILNAYEAAISKEDTEKAWFMQNRLAVEFGVKDVEAAIRQRNKSSLNKHRWD